MNKTAVVILNYNGAHFLTKFLPTAIERSPEAEIIVADNASTDDSVEIMQRDFPNIRLLTYETNEGYAGGYNRALKEIEAEYYILLNSDIEVTGHWIKPMTELMDQEPELVACQPKILAYYNKSRFEYAGASGGFIDQYGYPFCRGRIMESTESDTDQYNDSLEIFWATGACMIVRSNVFHELGGFDTDFFAHMEEIDFCWRAKNVGYKIKVQPQSVVYHVGGGTLPKTSPQKTYLNFRNNFMLLYKNLPSKRLFRVIALRLILDGVAGIKFLLEGHAKDMWAVVRAHFYFYRHLSDLRKKRAALSQNYISQIYQGSIVWAHFIKGIKKFSALKPEKFS
ncbi:MAG: glycosyltransferase family 2 protein [Bacteroidales bacterium]|nr:glycosyltransferase family 2 protein [Bacteroidales bacterium]